MIEAEPRLAFLQDAVHNVTDDGGAAGFCANLTWGEFKCQLVHLAGLFAGDEALCSAAHYDAAYRRLYQLLPPCRDCGCLDA